MAYRPRGLPKPTAEELAYRAKRREQYLLRQMKMMKEDQETRDLARVLTEEEVEEALSLTTDDWAGMKLIASRIGRGWPARNAGEFLQLLRTKLEFTREKPRQQVAVDGGIEVTVKTLAGPYVLAAEVTSATVQGILPARGNGEMASGAGEKVKEDAE